MRGSSKLIATLPTLVALAVPTAAAAATGGVAPPPGGGSPPAPVGQTGGSSYDPNAPVTPPPPPGPPGKARLVRGVAYAPPGAPRAVVRAIRAANKLQNKPYRYGGGHAPFNDTPYDCSRTGSFG